MAVACVCCESDRSVPSVSDGWWCSAVLLVIPADLYMDDHGFLLPFLPMPTVTA